MAKKKRITRGNQLGVIGQSPMRKPSAIEYYRMNVPLQAIDDLGLGNTYLTEHGENTDMIMDALMGADIIVEWRPMRDTMYEWFKQFSDFKPVNKNGTVVYPPILVMDSDDAVDWVHPFNYAFGAMGVRDNTGRLLKPGDTVTLKIDGVDNVLWEDKKTRGTADMQFDIERNLMNVGYHYDASRLAAGVTVTNDFLAQMYKDQGCEDIYVYPNSVYLKDHWFPELVPHEGVRIFWEGGASHMDSWLSIKQPLLDVLKRNPHAKLVAFGQCFDWMKWEIPEAQRELHGWIGYDGYKLHRYCMDGDINLCPLVDSAFTRSKSAIRWYEASLGPNPEATLAANVGPYQEIEHNKTGMLYNTPQEFAEMLHGLIANADLRKHLGAGAQKWVLANRTVEKTVPGLVAFYKHLLAKQRREFLKP